MISGHSSFDLEALHRRVQVLESESDIRKIQARYMLLCDTPLPEYGVPDDVTRIDLIMSLYCDDAVWEGVGEYYDNQFGRAEGAKAIRAHFEAFWSNQKETKLILNCHYLTSEQIYVNEDGRTAEGQWVHMQPWLFSDGKALLRSSRLNNAFRRESDGRWKISRTRTENVFVAPLPSTWASDYPTSSVLMKPQGSDDQP